ncbi:MAG: multidrug resistance protein Atm1 [Candidatus Xenolissoclinum pacificiensis L6]|uniref:Multidrug resistance protein Atm1 n=1 Tax=Candidatus Xenolissoclinum pacificiensis L6 TaxID=1401685 RepID=W2V1B3_9RICK|nr:MAG: multidrug resistance protein Atm1 [Candidatus Xenolissoclinum pacificiensis L6]
MARYMWNISSFKNRSIIIFALLMLFLSKICTTYTPYFFKMIIDTLSDGRNMSGVFLYIISYGLFKIVAEVFNQSKEIAFTHASQFITRATSTRMFSHIHSLSLDYHLKKKTGEFLRTMDHGLKSLEIIFTFSSMTLLPSFVEAFLVTILVCYMYGFLYTTIICITIVLYVLYTIIISEWRSDIVLKTKLADNAVNNHTVESLVNYETIKYCSNEKYEEKKYFSLFERYSKFFVLGKSRLSVTNIGQVMIISIGIMLVSYFAVQDIVNAKFSIGDLTLLNMYVLQVSLPLGNFGFAYKQTRIALLDTHHMIKIFDEVPTVKDIDNAQEVAIDDYQIQFHNVSFSYDNGIDILKGVNFVIPGQKVTAIVGETGAGKSTIFRLIFRFFDPVLGKVTVDKQDLTLLRLNDWRSKISVVSQDITLFNDTIYQNILYGNLSASYEQVVDATKKASLYNFVNSLPKKFDTIVGERGLKISGGEKQRLAIARAILKDAPIVLYDEPTSAIDLETEQHLQDMIHSNSSDKTSIIIAHRLSTITNADKIIVMKGGQVIEEGTHEELLNNKLQYYKMYMSSQK